MSDSSDVHGPIPSCRTAWTGVEAGDLAREWWERAIVDRRGISIMHRTSRTVGILVVAALAVLAGGITSAATAASYSTTPSATWVPNGPVYAIAEANGVVYIGGTFTALRGPAGRPTVSRTRLAALDATTGAPLPWHPTADGAVRALAVGPDGTVYAGGDFLNVNGAPATRIEAITPSGASLPGFTAAANHTVRKISASAAGVYAAGNFGRFNGRSRNGVVKMNPATGATDASWNAAVGGGKVRSLALSPDGTSLLVGGSFTSLSGQPHSFLGAVSLATGAAAGWAPVPVCATCQVLDISSGGGAVYTAIGGNGGGRAAAWSLASNNRLWLRHGDGDVQAVVYDNDTVYFGGHFGPDFDGYVRHQLVALSPGNGAVLGYALPMTGSDHPGVWALVTDGTALRIGGGFRLSTAPQARYAAFPLV